jgi:hypothetical protein
MVERVLKAPSSNYVGKILFALFLMVYMLEVVGKKYTDYDFVRPSIYIQTTAIYAMRQFYDFGNALADVFQYLRDILDFIDLKFFVTTFIELADPFVQLITSPFYFVSGYLSGLAVYSYPIIIFVSSIIFATSVIVLFEFVMRRRSNTYKPSKFIFFMSRVAEYMYKSMGRNFAYVSSFYHLVVDIFSLEEFIQAGYDLLKASGRFLVTPLFVVNEYMKTIESYRYPGLVAIGTLTLLLVIGLSFSSYLPTYVTSYIGSYIGSNITMQLA